MTPFLNACSNDREDVARWLVSDVGVSVNADRNNHGNTALLIACYYGYAGLTRWLLSVDPEVAAARNNV